MRYDNTDYRYIRSTMQEISNSDIGALHQTMREQFREQMNRRGNTPEVASPMKTILIIGGAAFAMYAVFSIGSRFLASSRGLLYICLAAVIFFIFSTTFYKGVRNSAVSHDKFKSFVFILFSVALTVAMPALYFLLTYENYVEKIYFIAGVFIGGIGLLFLIDILMIMTEKIRIYSMSVSATCTGYIRKISRVSDDTGYRTVESSSPLFSYETDEGTIEAFYDVLPYSMSVPVAMGETVSIDVDPRDQGFIMAPAGKRIVKNIFPAIILLAVGLFLIYGVLHGAVDGSSFNLTFGR